jgi:signal transduction histidine kinase
MLDGCRKHMTLKLLGKIPTLLALLTLLACPALAKNNNSTNPGETRCPTIDFFPGTHQEFPITTESEASEKVQFLTTDKEYEHTGHICLDIRNLSGTPQKITIRLDNSRIRHVEFFDMTTGYNTPLGTSGLEYPLKNWQSFGSEIMFNITLAPGTEKQLGLNFGSIFPYKSQIKISNSDSAFDTLIFQQTITGLLTGLIFSLVFYLAYLGINAKDKTSIYLFMSASCATLLQLNDMGLLYPLWPNAIYWNNISTGIYSASSTIFGIGLARHFLLTKNTTPRTDRILSFCFWYLIFIALPLPFFENDRLFLNLYAIPVVILVLPSLVIASIIRIRQGYKPAKIYLVALAMPIVSGLIIFLMYLGVLPSYSMTRILPLMGTALQLILFSFALGERINWLEEQKTISSQKELLSKTETSAKKNFLAHISHELRTPLAGIIGLADLAKKNALYSTNKALIDGISESATHLLETTNTLLDHARLDAGKWPIINKVFSPSSLIRKIVDRNKDEASKNNVTISMKVDKKTPEFLYGDADIIGRIMEIVIKNSILSTNDGCILVNFETFIKNSGSMFIRFDVIDTGRGISDERREKIFEIFELVDSSTTRVQQGPGLGLSLSRKFCDLLGGEIGYNSNPQQGTAFWCILPCSLPPEDAKYITNEAGKNSISNPHRPTSRSVLVAEDDETLQMIISSQLSKLGINHRVFPNGKPLLEDYVSNHQQVEAVLLDWNMPICNASEAIQAIRQFEKSQQLPPVTIAVLSAHDKHHSKEMNLSTDIKFLQKPVSTDDLVNLLIHNTQS